MEYKTNPVKAIREKCVDCCGGNAAEPARCEIQRCPIWPFRLGKNPYRTNSKREYTEEQREAQRKRMLEMLERKKNGV